MITGLDHIVILADNLAAATDRYAALGFAVERGGAHPGWGTENALVPLADGSYLELLTAHDPALARHHRLWQRLDGAMRAPGEYGGYFLGSDDLEHDVAVLRRRGLEWTDPQEGSRKRPDGQIVRWRLAFPKRPDLPNLIQDLTPRALRVAPPSGGLGARARVAEVVVAVADLDLAILGYESVLDARPRRLRESPHGHGAAFATAWGRLVLILAATGPSGRGRGAPAPPGIHSVTLQVDGWTEGVERIDPARTGGVRLDVRPA